MLTELNSVELILNIVVNKIFVPIQPLRHEENTDITMTIHMGPGFLTTITTPYITQPHQ